MAAPVARRPARRRALRVAVAVLTVLVLAVAAAPLWLSGPRLGRLVERSLPRTRGRVHVGGGSWRWGTVWALLRHHPAPLVFDDVTLTDPDGVLVLRARRISGALVRGRAPDGVTIHDLRVEDGAWRMASTADHRGIGFLRALELLPAPGGKARGATPSGLSGPQFIRVESAELFDLDVDFALPGWALSLRRLHGQGALALERKAVGPDRFTFTVFDAAPGGGGQLSVLDGTWRTTLPFSAARIARIAVEPDALDAIALDAPRIVTGRATTSLRGDFVGILPASGPARPAGLALALTMENAADAVAAIAAAKGWTPRLQIDGQRATLAMSFAGPFSAPLLDVRAHGFDVRFGALAAQALELHLGAQPAVRKVVLHELGFDSPGGGRLTVKAQLDGARADGALALDRFDTAPYLPAGLRAIASGSIDGRVEGHVQLDAGTAALDRVALTLARPPAAGRPAAVHLVTVGEPVPARIAGDTLLRLGHALLTRGTLELPRVTANVAGGEVAASGAIQLWDPARHAWLPSPSFDLTLDVLHLSVEKLLGVGLIAGQVSLRARAQGTFEAMTLRARVRRAQRVRVLGGAFTFALPPALALSLADGAVTLAPLTLSGADGAQLAVRGAVSTHGGIALQARASDVSLRPLAAWAAGMRPGDVPIDGRVGADLALAGDLDAPVATGRLTMDDVRFQDRPLGDGVLTLSTTPRGGLRLHGPVVDGVVLDGAVQEGAAGARGTATLSLSRLRLDPFLSALAGPSTVSLTGEATGTVAASVSPGAKPAVDVRLSSLTVAARAAAVDATPLAMQAAGPVHASLSSAGLVRLEPVHFSGPAGDLELSGEWREGAMRGHARGRLNAAPFTPLLRGASRHQVTALAGALDVDVGLASASGAVTARGSMTIAGALRARLAPLPFEVVASSGALLLDGAGAAVRDLVLNLVPADTAGPAAAGSGLRASGRVDRAANGTWIAGLDLRGALDARLLEPVARGYLRDAEGQARVVARVGGRLDGRADDLALHADVNVGGVAFTLMPGANRVRFASGGVTIDGPPSTPALAFSNVDLRVGDGNQLLIGGAGHEPGRLRLSGGLSLGAAQLDLPAQGRVRALATPVAIIDAASFWVRVTGVPGRSLRLNGDIFIDAAHVPPSLRRPKKPAPAAPGDRARAVLNATRLDLRVRSKPRAVTVEVAHVPDLHAALDYHLGGTVGAPEVTGRVKPAGVYSSVLLFLARLLD